MSGSLCHHCNQQTILNTHLFSHNIYNALFDTTFSLCVFLSLHSSRRFAFPTGLTPLHFLRAQSVMFNCTAKSQHNKASFFLFKSIILPISPCSMRPHSSLTMSQRKLLQLMFAKTFYSSKNILKNCSKF